MPGKKKSSLEIMRRWRDLDKYLTTGWVFVSYFAEAWNVSKWQVRRDLRDFKRLRQKIGTWWRDPVAKNDPCRDRVCFRYAPKVKPLFTANYLAKVKRRKRKRK
jgi:hypothetical protein